MIIVRATTSKKENLMKNKKLRNYCLLSLLGVAVVCFYPLYMGVRVVFDMIKDGTVMKENYPKYIIPYTPVAVALIVGVLLLPLFMKYMKKYAVLGVVPVSAAVFFAVEYLFEQKVVVTSTETVSKLADWQMYLCYMPPEEERYVTETLIRTEKPVEILIGEYNPAFKLHFYIISIVIIVCLLNCIYGFAELIRSGKKEKTKALVLQSISSVVFVGLCLLACFTAFWRDGQITVSPISAFLMILFFIVLGLNVGVFVGSFLLGKKVLISCGIPALVSAALTTLMYVGELILLHGHLYRFGSGFFFDGLSSIVFAPVDICVIILSGALAFLLMKSVNCNPKKNI